MLTSRHSMRVLRLQQSYGESPFGDRHQPQYGSGKPGKYTVHIDPARFAEENRLPPPSAKSDVQEKNYKPK